MTRPAKVSSSNQEENENGKGLIHSRPVATEARPNPIIMEDDNEGSTSRETTGNFLTTTLTVPLKFIKDKS